MIRRILAHGLRVWFNINAQEIEKLRHFERKCLRECLNRYRTQECNYVKFYSTATRYKEIKINGLDYFLLSLTGDHFAALSTIKSNDVISAWTDPQHLDHKLETKLIPSAAFIYLGKLGYLHDKNNILIIYHIQAFKSMC